MLSVEDLKNKIILDDCLNVLKQLPDKCVDLCLSDPPYGIGEDGGDKKRNRKYNRIVKHKNLGWDIRLTRKYFDEMFRVSKNQIIFGANYYTDFLPHSKGWIFWDKCIGGDFSDGELAFTSWKAGLRKITVSYTNGLKGGHDRVHPTQKPDLLFKMILEKWSEEGQIILDPFAGSGTTAIACHDLKRNFICIEKEPEYHAIATKRYNEAKAQMTLF